MKTRSDIKYDLSVIVPITRMYGRTNNLESWLSKVVKLNAEVILVHDIQDFETSGELEKLKTRINSSKLLLLEGKFGCPGGARNFGSQYASGTFIAFCDSDDIVHVDVMLETISQCPGYDVIVGGFLVIDLGSDKVLHSRTAAKNIFALAKNPGMWRFIFRAENVRNVEFTRYFMGEDQLFISEARIFNHKIKISKNIFYEYFINDVDQLTSNKSKLTDLLYVVERLKELMNLTDGKNRTLIELLMIKNLITLLKNREHLNAEVHKLLVFKLLPFSVSLVFRMNWLRAFSPLRSSK